MKNLTEAELNALVDQLHSTLEAGLNPQSDMLDRPLVLSMLFQRLNSTDDLRNLTLKHTFANYIGRVLRGKIPSLVQLHDTLAQRGIGADNPYEFGNDAYVYVVKDTSVTLAEDPVLVEWMMNLTGCAERSITIHIKAFVLETQNMNFLIVLNRRSGDWTVHIRQFWNSLQDAVKNKSPLGYLESLRRRKDLTLADLPRISGSLLQYANDVEGCPRVERLSLPSFLKGSLIAGDESAGPGLWYRDFRDAGYIASTRPGETEVETSMCNEYRQLDYVLVNLDSAVCVLSHDKDSASS